MLKINDNLGLDRERVIPASIKAKYQKTASNLGVSRADHSAIYGGYFYHFWSVDHRDTGQECQIYPKKMIFRNVFDFEIVFHMPLVCLDTVDREEKPHQRSINLLELPKTRKKVVPKI